MTYKYQKIINTKNTPQSQPVLGREDEMKKNHAGGFVFKVNEWDMLDRFLILGSERNTYYATAKKLTTDNTQNIVKLLKTDGKAVVDRIVEISVEGRAPKNDPALFALALAAGVGDNQTKTYALENLTKVARIGTHLFTFIDYVTAFRGWGSGLRKGISNWYLSKDVADLAYQVVKYQSREKWSHRDLLRLSHTQPTNDLMNALFAWIVNGVGREYSDKEGNLIKKFPHTIADVNEIKTVYGFELAKRATTEDEIVKLIKEYNLVREAIPTQFMGQKVYEALLPNMPMTALIRNLGNLSKCGLLVKGATDVINLVTEKLTNETALHKARVHPITILNALMTYKTGHGMRGSGEWEVVGRVIDALDEAFYLSFKSVVPTGKRFLLGVDISGSMSWPESSVVGLPTLLARDAAAVMAMVTARVEKNYEVMGFSDNLVHLNITPRQRLDDVICEMKRHQMGRTDCALPMYWALDNKREFDVFVVYTDNETWFGTRGHPFQALNEYRQKMGIPAKMIVSAFTSTNFTIADPNDAGMLDIVGFDSAAPNIMSNFVTEGGI